MRKLLLLSAFALLLSGCEIFDKDPDYANISEGSFLVYQGVFNGKDANARSFFVITTRSGRNRIAFLANGTLGTLQYSWNKTDIKLSVRNNEPNVIDLEEKGVNIGYIKDGKQLYLVFNDNGQKVELYGNKQ